MKRTERIAVPPLALTLDWKDGVIDEIHLDWASKPDRPDYPTPEAEAIHAALTRYVRGEAGVLQHNRTPVRPFQCNGSFDAAQALSGR